MCETLSASHDYFRLMQSFRLSNLFQEHNFMRVKLLPSPPRLLWVHAAGGAVG
jgi:hypothetical protein